MGLLCIMQLWTVSLASACCCSSGTTMKTPSQPPPPPPPSLFQCRGPLSTNTACRERGPRSVYLLCMISNARNASRWSLRGCEWRCLTRRNVGQIGSTCD